MTAQHSPETTTLNRNLTRSMGDAACFGGMVGCGESYLPAFALAVGMSDTAAGLVGSVPLFVGGILQLVSPTGIRWIGGLRRWVVAGATLQALAFIPLIVAAWVGELSLGMILLIASLYWATGLATGPAWNTWVEEIVPSGIRVRFFSRRSRLQQVCTFGGLVAAGVTLHVASQYGRALWGFTAIFVAATGLRLASAWFLFQHPRDQAESNGSSTAANGQLAGEDLAIVARPAAINESNHPLRDSAFRNRAAGRLLAYLVLMQVFIQISGPFFTPFMLTHLQFTYGEFVWLTSIAFVSKVLSIAFWGRTAEKFGADRLLWMGGIGLIPLSSFWIFSSDLVYLTFVQIIAGIAWAAYELGFFLSFFDLLPRARRTKLLTIYNFANTAAICLGAVLGAAIFNRLGADEVAYDWLFGLSAVGRLLCLAVLAGTPLPHHAVRTIALRILSVRVNSGSITSPVVAGGDD
ncbi:MFS transporter [Neorhodopirellula pilleata]|uniref:Major Facilitator Superfamily protein n=1 Tax=Neorhodopirellula pilleata TaxID=2714738 RepID=A0A5C6A3C4_9BACT|nr:MFS transporter [Neorhodopirellula pilleata]TWT93691.1 Major Facilitator Superfamily protein [Neorhodopirellula pilleata]